MKFTNKERVVHAWRSGSARIAAAWLLCAPAWAHEGHGAEGAHAHGFDLLIGLVGALLAVGVALWWRNKR